MIQYEYDIIDVTHESKRQDTKDLTNKTMNDMGSQGWELVSALTTSPGSGYKLWFRRAKNPLDRILAGLDNPVSR